MLGGGSYRTGTILFSLVREFQKCLCDRHYSAIKKGGVHKDLLIDHQKDSSKPEIRTWGFWRSFRPLLHHTSFAHNSHITPEPLSLSNCIKLWGKLVLVQYDANIWC